MHRENEFENWITIIEFWAKVLAHLISPARLLAWLFIIIIRLSFFICYSSASGPLSATLNTINWHLFITPRSSTHPLYERFDSLHQSSTLPFNLPSQSNRSISLLKHFFFFASFLCVGICQRIASEALSSLLVYTNSQQFFKCYETRCLNIYDLKETLREKTVLKSRRKKNVEREKIKLRQSI